MSGILNSSLNGSNSNLAEATGRALASSFSAQSANAPSFHHSGLHTMHGSFVPNILSSMASRNATMTTGPSNGLQQPVNISSGRFSSSNLPVALSQISHGHSGIPDRGGLNVVGSPGFSGGINGVGGSIPGVSSSSTSIGNRNSVPGMGVSPILGNLGPRISSTAGNISAGGSSGRNISSGGLTIPSLASRANLGANSASGAINVQGSNRLMGSMLQPGPQMMGMLRNSYTMSGGPISQSQLQGGNNLLSPMGMLNDVNSNDVSPFDINDFPQLTGRPNSAGGAHSQLGSLRKQGLGVSSIVQQTQEFSIQNEDFPALPGYKGGNAEFSLDLHQKEHHENVSVMQSQSFPMGRSGGFNLGGTYSFNRQQQQQGTAVGSGSVPFLSGNNQDLLHVYGSDLFQSPHGAYHPHNIGSPGIPLRSLSSHNLSSGIGSYDQLIQQYQHPQNQSQIRMQQISALNQSYRDHSLKSMQGTQTSDQFGLLGLLSVIRGNDPNLASLAMGMDLTTLGLNLLSSPGDLHKKFSSPWSDEPAKGEPEYSIPACYYSKPSPLLKQGHFAKFHMGTLFYIFYSMPKDEAQLFAANELADLVELRLLIVYHGNREHLCFLSVDPMSWYTRGWFYHKELRLWLMRIGEPLVKTQTYERGSYHYMDPNTWQTIRKDNFVLYYDAVENQAYLP